MQVHAQAHAHAQDSAHVEAILRWCCRAGWCRATRRNRVVLQLKCCSESRTERATTSERACGCAAAQSQPRWPLLQRPPWVRLSENLTRLSTCHNKPASPQPMYPLQPRRLNTSRKHRQTTSWTPRRARRSRSAPLLTTCAAARPREAAAQPHCSSTATRRTGHRAWSSGSTPSFLCVSSALSPCLYGRTGMCMCEAACIWWCTANIK